MSGEGVVSRVFSEVVEPPQGQAAKAGAESVVLVARDVRRTFHTGAGSVEVLKGVSLEIEAGEILFLRGASGAGKTTLLYTLAGLERPDSGTVEVDGNSLYGMPKRQQSEFRNRRIGYVFQHYFLLPDLTALENVLLPASMAGKAGARTARARELLEQVGLGDRLEHRPTELSGGEQQRVAIARSLINDPEILFADEPTGNLDSATGSEVIDALLGVVRGEKKTLIVVTHDPKLAALGDRQLEIVDGRIAL